MLDLVRRSLTARFSSLILLALAQGACGGATSGAGGGGDCGFVMPNPASAGLPHPASYSAHGDGTVTDNVTGLVWERAGNPESYLRDQAFAYCAAKGNGWRLPSRLELVSLVDFTIAAPGPTINQTMFPNTPPDRFWTDSPQTASNLYWTISFLDGGTNYNTLLDTTVHSVRCVRSPKPTCAGARYRIDAEGIVSDNATGLRWQPSLAPGHPSWDDAKQYCASLGTGWRLPSLTELQTLVSDETQNPALDPTAFPGATTASQWTSSLFAAKPELAWLVEFQFGNSRTDTATSALGWSARCVH
jgi:hypothetical protein